VITITTIMIKNGVLRQLPSQKPDAVLQLWHCVVHCNGTNIQVPHNAVPVLRLHSEMKQGGGWQQFGPARGQHVPVWLLHVAVPVGVTVGKEVVGTVVVGSSVGVEVDGTIVVGVAVVVGALVVGTAVVGIEVVGDAVVGAVVVGAPVVGAVVVGAEVVGVAVVGAGVVGAEVVGVAVVGAEVVGTAVVGAGVVGAEVVGVAVVGAEVVGAGAVGAEVVGMPVVGAEAVGVAVVGGSVVGGALVGAQVQGEIGEQSPLYGSQETDGKIHVNVVISHNPCSQGPHGTHSVSEKHTPPRAPPQVSPINGLQLHA
jgi:hypothetical protein